MKQAHGGIGASSHMACLLFTAATGVKPTLVAYRGVDPAITDLIGGHVDFFCEQQSPWHLISPTERSRLRGVGPNGCALPDLPTATEPVSTTR